MHHGTDAPSLRTLFAYSAIGLIGTRAHVLHSHQFARQKQSRLHKSPHRTNRADVWMAWQSVQRRWEPWPFSRKATRVGDKEVFHTPRRTPCIGDFFGFFSISGKNPLETLDGGGPGKQE